LLALLGAVSEAALTPASNCAEGGLLIDEPNQRIRYWTGRIARSWLADAVGAAWPGWDVARLDEGLGAQIQLVGDDPGLVGIPLAILAETVVEHLLRDGAGGGGGVAELVAELRRRSSEANVVVAPGAIRLPPGDRPDAAFLVGLLRALQYSP